MKHVDLTYEQAKAELAEIVGTKGREYVYEIPEELVPSDCSYDCPEDCTGEHLDEGDSCVYFNTMNDEPSCGIGYLLARHGMRLNDLIEAGCSNDAGVPDLIERRVFKVDENTALLLRRFQGAQDSKVPWGQALDEAVAYVEGEPS